MIITTLKTSFRKLKSLEKIYLSLVFITIPLFFGSIFCTQIERTAIINTETIQLKKITSEMNYYEAKITNKNFIFRRKLNSATIQSIENFPENTTVTWYSTNIFHIETTEDLSLHKEGELTIIYNFKWKKIVYIAYSIFLLLSIGLFFIRKYLKIFFIDKKGLVHISILFTVYVISHIVCNIAGINTIDLVYHVDKGLKNLCIQFLMFLLDFVWSVIFFTIIYILSNKHKVITYGASVCFIIYFYIANNVTLTFQNALLNTTNIVTYYKASFAILTKGQQLLYITFTIIFVVTILYMIIRFFTILWKTFTKTKGCILFGSIIFLLLFNFIPFFSVDTWAIDFKSIAQTHGIILTKNFDINYIRENTVKIEESDVKTAYEIILQKKNTRDITSLLVPSTKNAIDKGIEIPKRDVYLIFLESFYDYSHFITLFKEDPFSEEYRNWANNSTKIGTNENRGSFYARLAGLTGSSPLFPSTSRTEYQYFLPDLFNKAGYKTIALEEAGITYNLDKVLSALNFNNTTFEIGTSKLNHHIIEKILPQNESKFVYAFTYLGHTGSLNYESTNIAVTMQQNIEPFLEYFNELSRDSYSLYENLITSIQASQNVIALRDAILKNNPNALIIFKHDHLYPTLKDEIQTSTIDNEIKQNFLGDTQPSPFLVWDGQNGPYKVPKRFTPENIPLFIALNAGLEYENTPIDFLYKDTIKNQFSSYHSYYIVENDSVALITNKETVDKELLEIELATKTISNDIFNGKGYIYDLLEEN